MILTPPRPLRFWGFRENKMKSYRDFIIIDDVVNDDYADSLRYALDNIYDLINNKPKITFGESKWHKIGKKGNLMKNNGCLCQFEEE